MTETALEITQRLPGTNKHYRVIREGMTKHVEYVKGKPQKPVEYSFVVLGAMVVEKGKAKA